MLNLTGVLGWMQVAPSYVPPVSPERLGAELFNAGVHSRFCLTPAMLAGWQVAEAERLAEYEAPADFAAALEDYANGVRYCKPGIDWAAVEDERIGD